mmetsp:Transcript_99520/g.257199  ORF Transcript_99520/g.257199 Transcript_99520/m.257199 type:complete len:120 (+) Transcript_99520:328-687(+)
MSSHSSRVMAFISVAGTAGSVCAILVVLGAAAFRAAKKGTSMVLAWGFNESLGSTRSGGDDASARLGETLEEAKACATRSHSADVRGAGSGLALAVAIAVCQALRSEVSHLGQSGHRKA